MFRASLQDTQKTTTLDDEITLCKGYLRIEKHRLGERLTVIWDLDNIPGNFSLPLLCIQPLIENAIYHGIELNPDGGIISISGTMDDGNISIKIMNPINQSPSNITSKAGNRVAQENIKQRLASFFETDNLLTVNQDENTYCVTILIPQQT